MANLREIQRRMNSIQSTMQITRTMSMISTARIRQALTRAEEAAPYKETITRMLSHVATSSMDANNPLLASRATIKNVLYILIASDRGLAGGFNIQPQRAIEQEMKKNASKNIGSKLITCGRKPTEYFKYRGYTPEMSFVGISSEPTQDQADRIASYVMDAYEQGAIDKVVIYYWHAKNRVDQALVTEQLLPIRQEDLMVPNKPRDPEAMSRVEHNYLSTYTFEPSGTEVLSYLMPAYFRTVIYHALLDSAAAEHGARRRAMQSATDNAQEVLSTLSRTYNRTRQGAITTELNEIIGGASALEEN